MAEVGLCQVRCVRLDEVSSGGLIVRRVGSEDRELFEGCKRLVYNWEYWE